MLWPCFLPSLVPVHGEEEGEEGEVEGEEGLVEVVGSDPEAQVVAGAALALAGKNETTVQGPNFLFSKNLRLTHVRAKPQWIKDAREPYMFNMDSVIEQIRAKKVSTWFGTRIGGTGWRPSYRKKNLGK